MSFGGIQWASVGLAGLCLAGMLAGCAMSPGTAGDDAPAPTMTVTVTPTPEPEPEPETETTPQTITCETAFTTDRSAMIQDDGLIFRGAGTNADIDDLVGSDGLRCQWGMPGTDIVVRYADWERDATAWEALKTRLLAEGYAETGPSSISRQTPDLDASYSFRDGVVYYATPWNFIGWTTGLQ